jgi:hypothetical protein
LDFLKEENLLTIELHTEFYQKSEELSKMLFAMIRNLQAAA